RGIAFHFYLCSRYNPYIHNTPLHCANSPNSADPGFLPGQQILKAFHCHHSSSTLLSTSAVDFNFTGLWYSRLAATAILAAIPAVLIKQLSCPVYDNGQSNDKEYAYN